METIDGAQGREADIVILSLVRMSKMGFMKANTRRATVALTRAREYLFVFMGAHTYGVDQVWGEVVESTSKKFVVQVSTSDIDGQKKLKSANTMAMAHQRQQHSRSNE